MTTSLNHRQRDQTMKQKRLNFNARWVNESQILRTRHVRPKDACEIHQIVDDAQTISIKTEKQARDLGLLVQPGEASPRVKPIPGGSFPCVKPTLHVEENYYNSVAIAQERTPRLSSNGKIRRHSVDVYTVDLYARSGQNALSFDRKTKEDIEIKEPLLKISEPNAQSHSVWLDTSTSIITEKQFSEIDTTGTWFEGESVDTSLALLESILDCESHRIALCNTHHAYTLWDIGRDPNPNISDAPLVAKVNNKDFIVVPISDGWVDWAGVGQEYEEKHMLRSEHGITDARIEALYGKTMGVQSKGQHWSVMIVDGRGETFKGRYFDSFYTGRTNRSVTTAYNVLKGLRALEGYVQPESQDGRKVELIIDHNTPHQGRDNISGAADGGAACGPFAWAIIKEILQFIIDCREDGVDVDHASIALPAGFGRRWAWDSRHTRMVVKNLIERERRVRIHLNKAGRSNMWFDEGEVPGWKSWLARSMSPLPHNWFWDPYALVSESS